MSGQDLAGIRAVLLDFYGTVAKLDDEARSSGFDTLARRLALPMGPGELYDRSPS